MQPVEEQFDVGVIVGRFQVPELHDAHRNLIQYVCDAHDKVVILLGLSPLMVTQNNPLDFESRKQMLLSEFPNVSVLYVADQSSDKVWSRKLDQVVGHVITPAQSVLLYGGRDSFIEHYEGKYPTRELMQEQFFSGNEIRKGISKGSAKATPDFRAGVIWASQSQFPTCYPTVDVAIYNEDYSKLLLARKENEDRYRFVGGFASPESESYEADAKREVSEETGLEVSPPEYVGSFIVDDWRYRKEVDKIKTLLFESKVIFGRPTPDDDIVECRWFDANWGAAPSVVNEHLPLLEATLARRAPEQRRSVMNGAITGPRLT